MGPSAADGLTRAVPPTPGRKRKHDAFISYSHRSDDVLAPHFQKGLEQLAKRWNQRRALNVFLDTTDLGANTGLGSKLHSSLEDAEWLIVLASPASASSEWCNEEVEYWLDHRSTDRMLFVLTEGELVWTTSGDDVVDWDRSTAAPPALRGRLQEEPTHIDLRWAQDEADRLDIRHSDRFRAAVTAVAAPIRGFSSPKDLDSEDLRQYRLGRRLRRIAVGALAVLTVAAITAAIFAWNRKNEADRQAARSASRALANEALANADSDRDLSLLQALESVRESDTTDAWGSVLGVLGLPSRFQERSTDGHTDPVTAIAMNAEGTFAATGDETGKVTVWKVDPDALVQPATLSERLTGLVGPVQELAVFDSDGTTVVGAVSSTGVIELWDVRTGEAEAVPMVPPDEHLEAAAISSDGDLVAGTMDTDGNGAVDVVRLYRTDGSRVGDAPLTGDDPVENLRFRGNETLAWSQGSVVHLWDVVGQATPRELPKLETRITSIAFSPDGRVMAVGEVEGHIWLVDPTASATDAVPEEVEPRPTSAPIALAFDPAGSTQGDGGGVRLASAHSNGEVKVWSVLGNGSDPASGPPFGFLDDTLLGHQEATTALTFGAGGQIVSGSYDGQVLWWSALPIPAFGQRLPGTGDEHDSDVMEVSFLAPGLVASLDNQGQVIVTNLETGVGSKVPDTGIVGHLDAANDALVVTGGDGSIQVTQHLMADQSVEAELSGQHSQPVTILDLADDGSALVSIASPDPATGSVAAGATEGVVWDLTAQPRFRSRLAVPEGFVATSALYGANGRVWVGGWYHGAMVLEFDAASGALVGEPIRPDGGTEGDAVRALALSPDGRTLATGSNRLIHLWDPTSHQAKKDGRLSGHREEVSGLTFTKDGRSLISIDRDRVVNFWDLVERRLVTTFGGPTDGINDLALSAEGLQLVVATEDDAVFAWPIDKQEWIVRACALAGRDMTPDEWELYGRGAQQRLCQQYNGDFPLFDWSKRVKG